MQQISLDSHELPDFFAADALNRGRAYAAGGAVTGVSLHPDRTDDSIRVLAQVAGSRKTPYTVVIHLLLDWEGRLEEVVSSCSCPVGYACKHAAAALLVVSARQAVAPSVRSWQQELDGLLNGLAPLAPPQTELRPIALRFAWGTSSPGCYHSETAADLRLRPLRRGSKQRWVKTGLGWRDVEGAARREPYDPVQLGVLTELAQVRMANPYSWAERDDAIASGFGARLLPLLRDAAAAGIEFVPVAPLRAVHLLDTQLEVVGDVRRGDDATTISVTLAHDGEPWDTGELRCWGDPAHTAARHIDGDLTIAPLAARLPYATAHSVTRRTTVRVPHGEALDDSLRAVQRLVPLRSFDDTVQLPAPVLPRLLLTVRWKGAQEAHLAWAWRYGEEVMGLSQAAAVRDHRAEQALVGRLPQEPDLASRVVEGVDALHLALLELPTWRACDEANVIEHDAPDFREAQAPPEIAFDLVEPVEGASTDWLDLDVRITVDGERVLLADVLAALTLGHEHVVLPSGLFVRTDHPGFAQLDDLVRAAGELREREGERVSVGKHDLGLWGHLPEIGLVDHQAHEWVAKARALRELTELPDPEPTGLATELRPYQRDGFRWLAFLWQHRLGGVLADDMGLGKTLQVLALVAHSRATAAAPFLVVAPTSVVDNWRAEAARHAPGLRVQTISGTGRRRGSSIAEVAADADVVVTSYTLLRLEQEHYADVAWAGLVLDEAQQVKNHRSRAYGAVRTIEAPFRLAVTGTPFENRLTEMWALLSIVTPGLYPHPGRFTEHVARPVEKQGDADALRRFTTRIRPFLLRRTKELVAAELPPKQEQVLPVELTAAHRRLYDTHLTKERQRILAQLADFDGNRVAVLAALTKLRQLALDPALVDKAEAAAGSAKIDALIEHLAEVVAEGHQALVFSSFTGFLERAQPRLDAEGLTHTRLDGRTRDRSGAVETFRSGAASVFLISLKAGGVGLTSPRPTTCSCSTRGGTPRARRRPSTVPTASARPRP